MKAPVKQREVNPEGTYPVRVCQIIDLGTQEPLNEQFKASHQIQLGFENVALPELTTDAGDRFVTYASVTFSVNQKAKLYGWLKGLGIKKPEDHDIENTADKIGLATFEHNDKGYSNVKSIVALPSGMKTAKPKEAIKIFLMDPDQPFDETSFKDLPEFLQKKIAASPEYAELKKASMAPAKNKAAKGKKK